MILRAFCFAKAPSWEMPRRNLRSVSFIFLARAYRTILKQPALWLGKAAENRLRAAYESLGILYAQGIGLPQDFAAAADWFQRAAAEGSASALYNLGTLQVKGLGLPRDPERALAWFHTAANRGSADACLQLGILFAKGDLVAQSYEQAAHWYAKGAELGSLEAKYNLRSFISGASGVPADPARGH